MKIKNVPGSGLEITHLPQALQRPDSLHLALSPSQVCRLRDVSRLSITEGV